MIDVYSLQNNYIVIPKGWRYEEYDEYGENLRMYVIFEDEYESSIYLTKAAVRLMNSICGWENPKVFAKWDKGNKAFALEPTYSREARKFNLESELFEVYEDDERPEYTKSPISQTWLYRWTDYDSRDVGAALRAIMKYYKKDENKGFSVRGYWEADEQIMSFDLRNGSNLKMIKDGENWWLND